MVTDRDGRSRSLPPRERRCRFFAISVAGALLSTPTQAYDYGQHANTTLEKLINDYYRGVSTGGKQP